MLLTPEGTCLLGDPNIVDLCLNMCSSVLLEVKDYWRNVLQTGVPIEVNVSASFTELGAYIYPLVAKIMPKRLCLLKDLVSTSMTFEFKSYNYFLMVEVIIS